MLNILISGVRLSYRTGVYLVWFLAAVLGFITALVVLALLAIQEILELE